MITGSGADGLAWKTYRKALGISCLLLSTSIVHAQLSPYDDRLSDNIKYIRFVEEYAWDTNNPGDRNYHVNRGREMIDVERLRRALAEVHAAFEDDIDGELEPGQVRDYKQLQRQFVTNVELYRRRIDEMLRRIEEGGTPAEPARLRFLSLIEQNAFALPILMFEGETPWHDLYRYTLQAYQKLERKSAGIDPLTLRLPSIDPTSLGSTQIETVAMKRARIEAEADARKQQIADESVRDLAAVQANVAAEVEAANAAAAAEAERLREEAEAMIREAGGGQADSGGQARTESKGSGFFGYFFRLLITAGVVGASLWFLRTKLPAPVRHVVERAGSKSMSLIVSAEERVKSQSAAFTEKNS